MPIQLISYLQDTGFDLYNMREWLSGGAPPCQGGGRGFDPRLALEKNDTKSVSFFQTVDKAPSCEGALSTVCLFIVIFTVIFFFPNHASYFL